MVNVIKVDDFKALTDKIDNIATAIQNMPPSSGGVDYSTNEQNTGIKWTNGLDIYQKTFTVPLSSTSILFDMNIGTDITFVNAWGYANGQYDNVPVPFMRTNNNFVVIYYYDKTRTGGDLSYKGKCTIATGSATLSDYSSITVTIQYTKG